MYIIRPIQEKDLDTFEDMAKMSSLGIINLPKNREILHKKIQSSNHSFAENITQPYLENYIFVLENLETRELAGTCSISSRMGVVRTIYYLHIEEFESKKILVPVSYPIGPSEICALYLKPEFRKEGLGKLLSLSRFFFMANHRNRFENYTVAEMRGYFTKDKVVPFWEAIGRRFLDITYEEFCERELEESFVPSIMPKWPIYVSLLPVEAQQALGKTHEHTVAALKMLNREGFVFTQEIDPFDGGPKIGCKTDDIHSIKNSHVAKIKEINQDLSSKDKDYLISNIDIDFRACYGKVLQHKNGTVSISTDVADALNIKTSEQIRFIELT